MMQLQYRNLGTHQSLWATHTVDEGGLAAARWYEVRDPGGTPTLFQQGSLNPGDGVNRWMASIAADRDGNAAIGYSVSNSSVYPGIRYSGRLNGEIPGQTPQTERVLVNGAGSQTVNDRWGDYSTMSVDPTDDCTFWYTQEYYTASGNNWQTRIGSFKFPSCGQPKGTITGKVVDAATHAGIPGAPVVISSSLETISLLTDATGTYSAQVLPATYSVTAGPLLPGYPASNSASGQVVTASNTTSVPEHPAHGRAQPDLQHRGDQRHGRQRQWQRRSRSRRDRRADLRHPDQQRRGDQHRHRRRAQHHDARRDGYAKHVRCIRTSRPPDRPPTAPPT